MINDHSNRVFGADVKAVGLAGGRVKQKGAGDGCHRCMGDFFPGTSQINFKPETKARTNFCHDFLQFF